MMTYLSQKMSEMEAISTTQTCLKSRKHMNNGNDYKHQKRMPTKADKKKIVEGAKWMIFYASLKRKIESEDKKK
jgi:hypothetical protein